MIAFYGNQDITLKKKLLDARIDDFEFFLINIYNANTEKEQVSVLNELTAILSNFENIHNHNVIFAGVINIF